MEGITESNARALMLAVINQLIVDACWTEPGPSPSSGAAKWRREQEQACADAKDFLSDDQAMQRICDLADVDVGLVRTAYKRRAADAGV